MIVSVSILYKSIHSLNVVIAAVYKLYYTGRIKTIC